MRYSFIAAMLVLGTAGLVGQQQPPQPAIHDPHVVRFAVSIPAEDLHVHREFLPDQTMLTRVSLRPSSGEPVFYTLEPGYPRLPRLARFVALPPGSRVETIKVSPLKTSGVPNVPLLDWASLAQPGQFNDNPQTPDSRFAEPPQFPIDNRQREVFYPSAPAELDPAVLQLQVYPAAIAEEAGVEPHAGLANVLRLDLWPVQWHIQSRELSFTSEFQVEIRLSGGTTFRAPRTEGEANIIEDLHAIVVNPEVLPPFLVQRRPIDLPYLIITDDDYWTPDFQRTPGAGLVEPFERLAQWKTEKGIRAGVVRISDIVDGVYGDFRTGAADLQEVIRNFLKDVERRYNTKWALLGGDVEVIPPRMVAAWAFANAAHAVVRLDAERPVAGRSYWDAANGRVVFNTPVTGFSLIVSTTSGRAFPRERLPSPGTPGWRPISNSSCDMTNAPADLRCYEFVAPREHVENSGVVLVIPENTIPTDLYYSSLRGGAYDTPGRRDWDLNGDGIYGMNLWNTSADGVAYYPTLRLGRAPVGTADEARRFVNKVVEYERYQTAPAGFGGRLLLGAHNWGGGPAAQRSLDAPPPEGTFYHETGSSSAIAHFASAPGNPADWRLIVWRRVDSQNEFRYNPEPTPSSPGYYFCRDLACTARSAIFLWGTEIPIPTKFVRLVGPSTEVSGARYFFDHREPDGTVVEKEQVKDLFSRLHRGVTERRRLYKDIFDIPAAPDLEFMSQTGMRNALAQGVNVTSVSGHGWWGGCCDLPYDRLDELRNYPGVVYADSCLTAEFDQQEGDALGEVLLANTQYGAVGYIGNTRFSWVGLGASFERAFWIRLRSARQLGVLHDTKARYTSDPSQQWMNFSLHLLGDPEMNTWRGVPAPSILRAPREVYVGHAIGGDVLNGRGEPVALARVTLTGDRVFQTVFTDGEGRFRFRADGQVGQTLRITATHMFFDYAPARASVTIRPLPTITPPAPDPRW